MKKILVVVALAAAVAAQAAAGPKPLVPPFIQALVKQRAATEAYVPTRAPSGYAYVSYSWSQQTRILVVRLADRRYPNRAAHTIAFSVHPFAGNCSLGNQKSYQVDGNKVYSDKPVAWRCRPGVKILASGPNLPTVALAQVVASARRVEGR